MKASRGRHERRGAGGGPAQAEDRKIPAAQARRRARAAAAISLAGLAALWLVPALVLRPLANPAPLGFGTGVLVAIGVSFVRGAASARGSRRLQTATGRYLTAPTLTGLRTIDMRHLRRVRARREPLGMYTARSISYLVVTDTAGVRVSFTDEKDIRLIRRALEEGARQPQREAPARVSRLAKAVMGVQPLSTGASALWTIASAELSVLIALGCAFTIIGIASP
jgi:hypothetical protein